MPLRVRQTRTGGFTLVELLVVLAIVVVITSVVIGGENNFNKTFLLTNTTYDVALSYRAAQSYGLSSQQYAGTNNAGYGIHLGTPPLTSYTLFSDISPDAATMATRFGKPLTPLSRPGDGLYDPASNERVQTYTLASGFTIQDYCGTDQTTGQVNCASLLPGGTPLSIDVVFTRPNEQPSILASYGILLPVPLSKLCLVVRSPAGSTQYVSIYLSGEIATDTHCLP